MKTQTQKWGNSLAIRIPRVFAREMGLGPGACVNLQARSGKLVITPQRKEQFALKSLLAGVTKSNRHPETDWGGAHGREVW